MKRLIIITLLCLTPCLSNAQGLPTSARAEKAIASQESKLKKQLEEKDLSYGAPIFIRIFKQSAELELWVKHSSGKYRLFKNYKICTFSGKLGPKQKQGDLQSPEGFYFVKAGSLNPWSRFHLSFNLGYPNAYDRHHGSTGSALMVHGSCVSIGCYAMTDAKIEEIYSLAFAALSSGQPFFRVHAFPFRLTNATLEKYENNRWYGFWRNLQEGYEHFETYAVPPNVWVRAGRYVFDNGS